MAVASTPQLVASGISAANCVSLVALVPAARFGQEELPWLTVRFGPPLSVPLTVVATWLPVLRSRSSSAKGSPGSSAPSPSPPAPNRRRGWRVHEHRRRLLVAFAQPREVLVGPNRRCPGTHHPRCSRPHLTAIVVPAVRAGRYRSPTLLRLSAPPPVLEKGLAEHIAPLGASALLHLGLRSLTNELPVIGPGAVGPGQRDLHGAPALATE